MFDAKSGSLKFAPRESGIIYFTYVKHELALIFLRLQALEKVPRRKIQEFDPTEVTQHGLLEEMSILELRERLIMAKKKKQDEVGRTKLR